jgi:ubiquitin thioesterase CYLD
MRYSNKLSNTKDREIPRICMDLIAILCIETSHYVCFVKCGSGPDAPWCFFDSMADRKGEQNGYNIPEVLLFDEFAFWTSDNGISYLLNHKDDKLLPEMARRLICDAYLCFYQYNELTTYR